MARIVILVALLLMCFTLLCQSSSESNINGAVPLITLNEPTILVLLKSLDDKHEYSMFLENLQSIFLLQSRLIC